MTHLSANFILYKSKRTLREFVISNLTAEPCTFKTDAGGVSRASKFEARGLWSRCRVWRLGSDNMLALFRLAVCFLTLQRVELSGYECVYWKLRYDQNCSFRSPFPRAARVTDSGQCETLLWAAWRYHCSLNRQPQIFKCGWEKLPVTDKTQMDSCLSMLNIFFFNYSITIRYHVKGLGSIKPLYSLIKVRNIFCFYDNTHRSIWAWLYDWLVGGLVQWINLKGSQQR